MMSTVFYCVVIDVWSTRRNCLRSSAGILLKVNQSPKVSCRGAFDFSSSAVFELDLSLAMSLARVLIRERYLENVSQCIHICRRERKKGSYFGIQLEDLGCPWSVVDWGGRWVDTSLSVPREGEIISKSLRFCRIFPADAYLVYGEWRFYFGGSGDSIRLISLGVRYRH